MGRLIPTTDRAICPGCGTSNVEAAPFCAKCGAPLTSHATTDPMGSIFAQGYAARRAVAAPDKPIVLIGLWLWMLPLTLAGLIGLFFALPHLLTGLFTADFEAIVGGLIATGASALGLAIGGAMLLKATRNYRKQPTPLASTPVASSVAGNTRNSEREPAAALSGETVTCLACGKSIPPHTPACTACGWTYQ